MLGKMLTNSILAGDLRLCYQIHGTGSRLRAKSGGDSSGNNLRTVTYTPDALNQYDAIATPGSFDVLVRSADTVGVTVNATAATMTRQGNLHRALANVTNTTTGAWAALSITSPAGTGTPSTGNRWVPKATTVPVYDADGNLTNDGRWEYVWDGENRLVSMTTLASGLPSGMPRKKLEFAYDWMSRRIAKKVSNWSGSSWTATDERRFTYDGWNLVGEFKMVSGTRTLEKTYLWGTDLSGTPQGGGGVGGLLAVNTLHPSSSTCYPAYDGNGNIIAWTALVSGNGITLQRIDYDPFGNVLTREGQGELIISNFGFSTKYQDESGLLYYGLRYYDPVSGRWPSRDPIGERGGVNLYTFVRNNGMNRWDYLGMTDLTKPADPGAAHTAVHEGGVKALKDSEKEYLGLIMSNQPMVITPGVRDDKPYKPKRPREYGGKVCEKCDENGAAKYSYYITLKTDASWPWGDGASVNLDASQTPNCSGTDKHVANWHTHPSNLFKASDRMRKAGKLNETTYYWSGGDGFSGANGRVGDHGAVTATQLALYVTRRNDSSSQQWGIDTSVLVLGAASGRKVKGTGMLAPEWVDLQGFEP